MLGPPGSCYSPCCLGNPSPYCCFHSKLLVQIVRCPAHAQLHVTVSDKAKSGIALPFVSKYSESLWNYFGSSSRFLGALCSVRALSGREFKAGNASSSSQAGLPGAQEVIFLTQKVIVSVATALSDCVFPSCVPGAGACASERCYLCHRVWAEGPCPWPSYLPFTF